MDLAEKVAADATSVSKGDIERLLELGLSERDVLDVVLTAAARSFFAEAPDAMGVAPDGSYRQLDEGLAGALTVGRPIEGVCSPLTSLRGLQPLPAAAAQPVSTWRSSSWRFWSRRQWWRGRSSEGEREKLARSRGGEPGPASCCPQVLRLPRLREPHRPRDIPRGGCSGGRPRPATPLAPWLLVPGAPPSPRRTAAPASPAREPSAARLPPGKRHRQQVDPRAPPRHVPALAAVSALAGVTWAAALIPPGDRDTVFTSTTTVAPPIWTSRSTSERPTLRFRSTMAAPAPRQEVGSERLADGTERRRRRRCLETNSGLELFDVDVAEGHDPDVLEEPGRTVHVPDPGILQLDLEVGGAIGRGGC